MALAMHWGGWALKSFQNIILYTCNKIIMCYAIDIAHEHYNYICLRVPYL